MRINQISLTCLLALFTAQAQGLELGAMELNGSGFLTLGLGSMLGGTHSKVNDYECPCFTSDYAQAGVYDNGDSLQWKPDSKIGLQGSISFDQKRYMLTAQAVLRGARDGAVNLEWLYGSFRATDKLTLQLGRKRLPMFYFSDTQDVGLTMPWTHLPPQLYGWEAVNYNGVNVSYQDNWGSWSGTFDIIAGRETKKDSGYWKIYNGRQSKTDVKWDNIFGGVIALNRDWLETRFVYIQSKNSARYVTGVWDPELQVYDNSGSPDYGQAYRQRIFGVAANIDYNSWLARSEFIYIKHPGLNYTDSAQILAVGYRHGNWQPMLTWSNYESLAVAVDGEPAPTTAMEAHFTTSLTLRYELNANSAVKVQYDDQRSRSGPDYPYQYGDARLLSLSYDLVF